MPVSEATYQQLALEDTEGNWELHCGYLRRKPTMSVDHNRLATRLLIRLANQLDDSEFDVRINMGRVRHSGGSYYIPDVYVIPVELVRPMRGRPGLEVYEGPLPLVVEVWSPSTGEYDVDTKLPEYQRRGDLEIWRLHPYDRTLTAWRRQPDGSYNESQYTGGIVRPVALPGVAVDLDTLFD
jgi:Uma2 family endonuclease